MKVFVINSGSSSIKYQLIDMPSARVICSGLVDRIGQEGATVLYQYEKEGQIEKHRTEQSIPDHAAGLKAVAALLTHETMGVIRHPEEITVVGHRVVHGGESFAKTMVITPAVKDEIRKLFSLAPLHNPPNYLGIEVAEHIFSHAKQVAVFDTAFHQTMPPVAYRMAVPQALYDEHRIRAYGFHGTSHKYVSEQAASYLKRPDARLITIHLGNGCSMAAIRAGQCVDTTMGLGPMNGLVMGTRAGDLDQSVIFHLIHQLGYTADQVFQLLNKKSGMIGLTGFSDMRDVQAARAKGDPAAALAYDLYAYHIKKYIGAYLAVLNGCDALVFTAGVGENDALTRALSTQGLDSFGIRISESRNQAKGKGIREIQEDGMPVRILVVPTNEELEIARQCHQLLS